jgi:RHS repeat-associated protein
VQHDNLDDLTSVTQNAQAATAQQQTRTYTYDMLKRSTSETNPESGTTTYTYDTDVTCGTSTGDLVKKIDAMGNTTCYAYDALHRGTSVTYSGPYAAVTPNKYFVYDSATVNGAAMANAKGRLGEAYTAQSQGGTKLTDAGFSYTARGEVSDVYQETPNSNGYYHLTQNYWPHGLPNQLSGLAGLPTINFGGTPSAPGLDGEGRVTQVTASSGQNPVNAVNYNPYGTPPQTTVTFGSGDSDVFSFDANTGRMTQYRYNVGNPAQAVIGNLTWNPNGTLAQLAITDPFDSANNQTINYGSDDLTRVSHGTCAAGGWGQQFTYDPFGNITKTVPQGNYGASFQPIYQNPQTGYTSNRYLSIGSTTVQYDSNGNVLTDGTHQYAWDADGNSVNVDGVGQTFDALDRVVEQNRSGVFTQIAYAPTGDRLALMSGQSLQKAFVPLPGAARAVYTAAGLDHYRHADWLGSARFASTANTRQMYADQAYAPFGEAYAQAGATNDLSFTGMDMSTSAGDYDFPAREYDATAGRWPTPDPAGLAAAEPSDPQSWNRYAYVRNRPLNTVDPTGLTGQCGALNYDAGTAECGGGSSDGDLALMGLWADSIATMEAFATRGVVNVMTGPPVDVYIPERGIVTGYLVTASWTDLPWLDFGGDSFGQSVTGGVPDFISQALQRVQNLKLNKPDCVKDLTALGTNADAVRQGAALANLMNGVGSNVLLSSLGSTESGTVGEKFATTNAMAVSQLHGHDIYVNPAQWTVDHNYYYANTATMLHEVAVHNVAGLGDAQAQAALGIKIGAPSGNITEKLLTDCF